jgi:hypothetical protein
MGDGQNLTVAGFDFNDSGTSGSATTLLIIGIYINKYMLYAVDNNFIITQEMRFYNICLVNHC